MGIASGLFTVGALVCLHVHAMQPAKLVTKDTASSMPATKIAPRLVDAAAGSRVDAATPLQEHLNMQGGELPFSFLGVLKRRAPELLSSPMNMVLLGGAIVAVLGALAFFCGTTSVKDKLVRMRSTIVELPGRLPTTWDDVRPTFRVPSTWSELTRKTEVSDEAERKTEKKGPKV